jgi:hypothetical protein
MRAHEFLKEGSSIPKNHADSTPDMRSHKHLDNSSPYAPWRFSAHFLGGADGKNPYEHQPEREGPSGQALVTVSYTPEEEAMVRQAERAFGSAAGANNLSSRGSKESDDTHKVSPIGGFRGHGSGNKKKTK